MQTRKTAIISIARKTAIISIVFATVFIVFKLSKKLIKLTKTLVEWRTAIFVNSVII